MFTPNTQVVKEHPIKFQEVPKVPSKCLLLLNPDTTPPNFEIQVMDTAGVGGGNNHYVLRGFDIRENVALTAARELHIFFHNGPVVDGKFNGITIEMLLAVCKDRLEGFQDGAYPSEYNEIAIASITNALHSLGQRTRTLGQDTKPIQLAEINAISSSSESHVKEALDDLIKQIDPDGKLTPEQHEILREKLLSNSSIIPQLKNL